MRLEHVRDVGDLCTEGRLHVLVVDDDPDYLRAAELALEAEGFQVSSAAGGLQGLMLAGTEAPDAILCDFRMPGLDGHMVAVAVRNDGELRNTALVACSGDRPFLQRQRGAADGLFDAVLSKPADWSRVADMLRAAVVARRLF